MKHDIAATFETITPGIAAEMLETSDGNRSLKRAKVDGYSREMLAGRWMPNGEPIIFDSAGTLIDGHHRLTACMKSGTPFQTLVVRGAPIDARQTIDMGASRTTADALGFYGYQNANHLSAIVRILLSLRNGRVRSASPTTQEVFDFVGMHPETEEAARFASSVKVPRVRSLLGAVYVVAAKNGCAWQAEAFGEVLKTGVPSMHGCAAHALRERIYRSEISGKKISTDELQSLVIAAWEKFRIGAPVKILKPALKFRVTGW